MHRPEAVANEFISLSNFTINPLKLNKLLYFAQGWSLALLDEPLFDCPIEAWEFGTMIVPIFHLTKGYGNNPITRLICVTDDDGAMRHLRVPKDTKFMQIIQIISDEYGKYESTRLSNMTHLPEGPWRNMPMVGEGAIIPNEMIKRHFKQLAKNNA